MERKGIRFTSFAVKRLRAHCVLLLFISLLFQNGLILKQEGRSVRKRENMKTSYDDCTFCGGRVTGKPVQKACWWGDKLMAIIDNVPAGVCEQCGERYYEAKVVKDIDELLKKKQFTSTAHIPLANFA